MFQMSLPIKLRTIFFLSKVIFFSFASEVEVDWIIPSNGEPLPQRTVAVGDTALFKWPVQGTPHNVYVHPSGTCDEIDAAVVAAKSDDGTGDNGGYNVHDYTFTE